ncbi:hypothetical protein DPMN_087985 [Dreissena polymorpha]|uniref:Uncharacterized protein n=1 Tax=Dreissena polymorpha TaxID=45954 RepID=A0A9D4QWW6_DREPO|nr:hypothetical protein DPMN_087985 [Dreissena polymorpha]
MIVLAWQELCWQDMLKDPFLDDVAHLGISGKKNTLPVCFRSGDQQYPGGGCNGIPVADGWQVM